jgi:hypothetical protein
MRIRSWLLFSPFLSSRVQVAAFTTPTCSFPPFAVDVVSLRSFLLFPAIEASSLIINFPKYGLGTFRDRQKRIQNVVSFAPRRAAGRKIARRRPGTNADIDFFLRPHSEFEIRRFRPGLNLLQYCEADHRERKGT